MKIVSLFLCIMSFSLGFVISGILMHTSKTANTEVISQISKCKNDTEDCVDLGLPSGLKWAICNVGAAAETEVGLYFCWGDTEGYSLSHITNENANLRKAQDPVNAYMGDNWRMPTKTDFDELIANCNTVWTNNYNGSKVAGNVFTSKFNGNKIFFPAGGAYPIRGVKNINKQN